MISVPSVFDPDYDLEFVRDVALSPQFFFKAGQIRSCCRNGFVRALGR